MATINTRALKDQLSGYLHRAEQGEQVIVTRSGKPVAALVPISQIEEADEEALMADMARRGLARLPRSTTRRAIPKKGLRVGGTSVAQMVIEDRR